jgi:hypothetical protein
MRDPSMVKLLFQTLCVLTWLNPFEASWATLMLVPFRGQFKTASVEK